MKRKKRESAAEASNYRPTEREQSALRKFSERRDAELATQIKVVPNEKGGLTVEVNHEDIDVGYALLAEALGTANIDFIDGLVRQLADAGFSCSRLAN
jgi:hypothetical protein